MKLSRFDFWFLASIFIFNILLKLFRLNSPAEAYFDEVAFYIPAARDYLQGNFDVNFEHPPVAKLLMTAGVLLFGDNPWGWRVPEVLVGSVGIIFIFLLAKKMFGGRFIPVLASVFLTFEFSWFVNSRITTLEIYVASFSLAAAYFFWNFFKEGSLKYLGLTGFFFGLAIASKWNGLFLLTFVALYYLWFRRKKIVPALAKTSLIVLIAAGVYLGSYSFYLTKHSLVDFVNLQVKMVNYHVSVIPETTKKNSQNVNRFNYHYTSWAWFLNPIYPFFGESSGGKVHSVLFLFNPGIFWGSLVAIILSIKKLAKSKEKLFLVGSFAIFWLPWLIAPRLGYPYYLLSSMPFAVLLLAKIIDEKFERRKFLLTGFVALVVVSFFFYYPLLTNLTIPTWYLTMLTGTSGFKP